MRIIIHKIYKRACVCVKRSCVRCLHVIVFTHALVSRPHVTHGLPQSPCHPRPCCVDDARHAHILYIQNVSMCICTTRSQSLRAAGAMLSCVSAHGRVASALWRCETLHVLLLCTVRHDLATRILTRTRVNERKTALEWIHIIPHIRRVILYYICSVMLYVQCMYLMRINSFMRAYSS